MTNSRSKSTAPGRGGGVWIPGAYAPRLSVIGQRRRIAVGMAPRGVEFDGDKLESFGAKKETAMGEREGESAKRS